MTVVSVSPNATDAILADNRFNDPPGEGRQYYMVGVRAKYLGSESDRFDGSFRLRAVGPSSIVYTTFSNSCGVIPQVMPDPDPEVFAGGEITTNVCWEIASTDADTLQMFSDPFLSEQRAWFALK